MPKKTKQLCKWKKADLEKRWDELVGIVAKPRFICRKCGHVSDHKKWLCKPEKLDKD